MTKAAMKKSLDKADALMAEAMELLRQLGEEKRTEYDEMSEKRQEGDAGQQASDLADSLETAADEVENAQSSIQAILTDFFS